MVKSPEESQSISVISMSMLVTAGHCWSLFEYRAVVSVYVDTQTVIRKKRKMIILLCLPGSARDHET
jgi:hypothetical protein